MSKRVLRQAAMDICPQAIEQAGGDILQLALTDALEMAGLENEPPERYLVRLHVFERPRSAQDSA